MISPSSMYNMKLMETLSPEQAGGGSVFAISILQSLPCGKYKYHWINQNQGKGTARATSKKFPQVLPGGFQHTFPKPEPQVLPDWWGSSEAQPPSRGSSLWTAPGDIQANVGWIGSPPKDAKAGFSLRCWAPPPSARRDGHHILVG